MELPSSARRALHHYPYGDGYGDLHDSCCPTALVSDTHAAEIAYRPYQRPPQASLVRTAIPRGLVTFNVRGDTLAAKPVNDTILLSINFTLPGGFGYILAEISFNLECDTATDWNANAMFLMAAPTPESTAVDVRMPIEMASTGNGGVDLGVRLSKIPAGTLSRIPIMPGQSGTFTSLRYANLAAAAQAAGTVDAIVAFWQYDLEQMENYPAHMAANVVGR